MNSDMNSISSITNSDEGANSGHPDKQTEVKIKSLEHGTPILNVSDARGNNEGLTAYGEVDTRLISSNSASQRNPSSLPMTKNEDISVDLDRNRKRPRSDSWVDSYTTVIKRTRVEEVIVLDSSDDSDCESLNNGDTLKQSNKDSSCTREKEGGLQSPFDDNIRGDDENNARDSKDTSATSSNVKQVGDLITTKTPSTPMFVINLLDSDNEGDVVSKHVHQDPNKNECIDLTANDSDKDEEDNCCKQKSIESIMHAIIDDKSKPGSDIFLLDDSDREEELDESKKSSPYLISNLISKMSRDLKNSSAPVIAKSSSEFTPHLENVSSYKDTLPDDTSTSLPLQDQNCACSPKIISQNTFATSNCIRPPNADEDSGFENLNNPMLQNKDTYSERKKTNSNAEISQSTGQLKSDSVSASEKRNVSENQEDNNLSRNESESDAEIEQCALGSKHDTIQQKLENRSTNHLRNKESSSKEFNNSSRHIRKILPPKKTTSSTACLPRLQKLSIQRFHHMKNKTRTENVFELKCHQDARSLLESRVSSKNSMILPIEAKDLARCTSFFYYVTKSYYFDALQKQKVTCIYCKSFSTKSHVHNPQFLCNHTLLCSKVPHDEKEALKILEGAQKSERNLSSIRFSHKGVINDIFYRIGARKNDENEVSGYDSEWDKTSKSVSLDSSKDSSHVKDNRKSRNHQIEPELHRRRRSRSIPKYTSSDNDSLSLSSTDSDPFADFDSYDQMIHQSYKSHTSKSGLPSRWITVQNYSSGKCSDVPMNVTMFTPIETPNQVTSRD